MKIRRLWFRSAVLAIILAAVGYTVYSSFFQVDGNVANAGYTAPDFKLMDVNGKPVELKNLRGKGVLLNFWGSWCGPCKQEMPYLQEQYTYFKNKGIEVLAVNVGESNVAVQNFVNRFHLSFPIPMDQQREVTKAYGIGPIPTSFLIDKNGKIILKTTDSLNVEQIYEYMKKIQP